MDPDSTTTEDIRAVSVERQVEEKPALSKNQIKKQLRLQRWAETKKERRKKEREKMRERKRREIEERKRQGLDDTLPVVKKKKMSDPEASDIRVAIDCAYDSFMTEPDIKKLIKQIQRCYAENRKSAKPLQLCISSFRDKAKQLMDSLIPGYQNWDVHLKAESPNAAFGPENIVYLAAESPNVLQSLKPDKVYIIGGLVDHNHHKGVCFKKVTEMGWSHAQLPIGDFVKLNSRKVLAVNHVYEIILAFIQLGSWRDAFYQVLPSRKVAGFYPEGDPPQSTTEDKPCTEAPVEDDGGDDQTVTSPDLRHDSSILPNTLHSDNRTEICSEPGHQTSVLPNTQCSDDQAVTQSDPSHREATEIVHSNVTVGVAVLIGGDEEAVQGERGKDMDNGCPDSTGAGQEGGQDMSLVQGTDTRAVPVQISTARAGTDKDKEENDASPQTLNKR